MKKILLILLIGAAVYFGYQYFFVDHDTAKAAVVVTTTAVTTGFWATLIAGGWFLGEMTFFLWALLALFVFIPLGFIAHFSELPDDRETLSGRNIVFSMLLCAGMVLLLNWGGLSLWVWVKTKGLWAGLYFLGFVAIGVLWSFHKYNLLAKDCAKHVRTLLTSFCKDRNLNIENVLRETGEKATVHIPKAEARAWKDAFEESGDRCLRLRGLTAERLRLQFSNNKERIATWILFWPASMLRGLFRDILVRVWDWFVASLRGFYEQIAGRHALDVSFDEAPKPAEESSNGKSKD